MPNRPHGLPRTALALIVALLGLLLSSTLVAGCSGDDSGSSGSSGSAGSSASSSETPASPSPTSDACASIDQLRTDVTAMAQSTSIEQFNGHFEAARADFAQVRASASAELGPAVDKVEKALQGFGDAIGALGDNGGNGGNGQQVQQLAVAAQQLVTSVQALASQASC